jgi:hypothetical protein
VKSIRQSVTVPEDLARKIGRGAKKKHLIFSKALIEYDRLGVAGQREAAIGGRVVEKIQAATSREEAEALTVELTEAVFGPQSPNCLRPNPVLRFLKARDPIDPPDASRRNFMNLKLGKEICRREARHNIREAVKAYLSAAEGSARCAKP